MSCNCEFSADPSDPDEDTQEKSWHYYRECPACGFGWFGLHCAHDGIQNPCPRCGVTPTPVVN